MKEQKPSELSSQICQLVSVLMYATYPEIVICDQQQSPHISRFSTTAWSEGLDDDIVTCGDTLAVLNSLLLVVVSTAPSVLKHPEQAWRYLQPHRYGRA